MPATTVNGSLQVDSTMTVSDTLRAQGDVLVNGSVKIDSTLIVSDTMRAQKDLIVQGTAKILGDMNVSGKISLGNNGDGFTFTTGNATIPNILSFGKGSGSPLPLSACVTGFLSGNPNLTAFQLKDILQVGTSDPLSTGYLLNGSVLSMQSWASGSSIDVSGGTGGNGGLLINYFCGKNTYIGTGTGGGNGIPGKVYIGDELYARKNVQIGNDWQAIDPNVNLNIFAVNNTGITLWPNPIVPTVKLINDNYNKFTIWGNGDSHFGKNMQIGFPANSSIQDANVSLNISSSASDGIKLSTYNNNAKSIAIINPNLAQKPAFVVTGEGKTEINTFNSVQALAISGFDGSIYKKIFAVKGNGATCIGCDNPGSFMLAVEGKMGAREIKVTAVTPWPDYVFSKDYDLTPLENVKEYTVLNKHLPGIPTAKELENENYGLDVAKMQGLQMQKIEEIYLYLFEMKKEIDSLKAENENLKQQIKLQK